MFKLAVLISGSGTTLQNLIDRAQDGTLPVQISGVISSHADVYGVERARTAGLPVRVVDYRNYRHRPKEFSAAISSILDDWNPDLVVMAGFIRHYQFPARYRNRIINIHPALLPKFGGKGMWGLRVHSAVLAAGARESGCTVHYVDHLYDHGSIILQRKVTVEPTDTAASLQSKVQTEERLALPEAILNIIRAGAPAS